MSQASTGSDTPYDVLIVGGGPGGLSAALALGRARKRVLVCDSGPRRNAAAEHLNNFITRDGTPPAEFRAIGRQQLTKYPKVEVRDERVEAITGTRSAFRVTLSNGEVRARRVILCTGMIDEMLPIPGFRELWGRSIFQCPYCHGWEVQDRRWGYLAPGLEGLHFPMKLPGWTRDVVLFTNGAFELPDDARERLTAAGLSIETAPIERLVAPENRLEAIELTDGRRVPCEVLYAHPPQRQVDLVGALGVALDEDGYVQQDPTTRETSVPGVYAAGDLTSRMQGAIIAAANGTLAATSLNMELTVELATNGLL